MDKTIYRYDLDFLKGIAIIAVVFYHSTLLQSGYLGVDLFFVINGFLIIPSLCRSIANSKGLFFYFLFLRKRLIRLWPLIIIASIVCFLVGFFVGMLPDDFENLNETIVASNLMSNNLLSAITIRDYWAVRTSFQPLMHLWYVGILFEFYLVTPLFLYIVKFFAKKCNFNLDKSFITILLILSLISLVIYLLPSTSEASRFYHLHSRYYEMGLSGVVALLLNNNYGKFSFLNTKFFYYSFFILLLFCLVISLFDINYLGQGTKIIPIGAPRNIDSYFLIFNRKYLLLLVVALSILIVNLNGSKWLGSICSANSPICFLGKISFSIYIWHQILLAFERYFYSNNVSISYMTIFLLITLCLSIFTYSFIEQRVKSNNRNLFICVMASFSICSVSYYYYTRAGVTRDVPELGVSLKEATKKMHSKYLKRTYKMFNNGYSDNGKYNICAIGNSFMSDFVNILKESSYADSVNLIMAGSYSRLSVDIIQQSDYVFIFDDPDNIPSFIKDNIEPSRIYGIGTKNFGDSNGAIYRQRYKSNYYHLSFKPYKEYVQLNNLWQKKWGRNYINLLELCMLPNGEIRLFTPDNKYMSQDCRHLTQPGARYFADRIEWSKILKIKRPINRKIVNPVVK